MPKKNADLHGAVPDSSPIALVIIDIFSDYEATMGPAAARKAVSVARRIKKLKSRVLAAGLSTIYLNDNVGRWQASLSHIVDQNTSDGAREITSLLAPEPCDYFVAKPKHSGFYATPLALILKHLNTHSLILTGSTLHQCVLFTTMDAYLQDFELFVPMDCVVTADRASTQAAQRILVSAMDADLRPSSKLVLTRR